MPSVWEVLQQIASLTQHVSELQSDTREIRQELHRLEVRIGEDFRAVEARLTALEAAQATSRETIRAEIATAVADLRVRYAEEQVRRSRPQWEEGS